MINLRQVEIGVKYYRCQFVWFNTLLRGITLAHEQYIVAMA